MGPSSGVQNWVLFLAQQRGFFLSKCEVKSWLQWAKSCRRVDSGKEPLFVNMDETSVCLNYGKGRGFIVSKRALPPGKSHRKEQISSSDAKARVSLLTFLTHKTHIQPKLPQIILGNKHQLSVSMLKQLQPHTPKQFYVWREESSWVNHAVVRRVLSLLSQCLQEFKDTHQIIFVLDCAKCHIHPTVFQLASRLQIKLLFVPAKLTSLLQPADTHCFSKLKRKLKQKWLQLRVESSTGEVSHLEWFMSMLGTVSQLLCSTKWESAFLSAGLLDETKLSCRVCQQLGWTSPVVLPADILSDDQLRKVLPKRSRLHKHSLFSWAMPKATGKAMPKAKALAFSAEGAAASLDHDGPISSRTRKRSVSHVA